MKCSVCGSDIKEGASFCDSCGSFVKSDKSEDILSISKNIDNNKKYRDTSGSFRNFVSSNMFFMNTHKKAITFIFVIIVFLVIIFAVFYVMFNASISKGNSPHIPQIMSAEISDKDETKRVNANRYEKDYIDIDGATAASIADEQGMAYEEFLEMYGLPSDLPKETNGNATENLIPLGKYAELMDTDLDTLREQMGWDDSFTAEMTIGEARDRTLLSRLVGEDSLEEFKESYGLGKEITGDTFFGEVRHELELKEKERYEEQADE